MERVSADKEDRPAMGTALVPGHGAKSNGIYVNICRGKIMSMRARGS